MSFEWLKDNFNPAFCVYYNCVIWRKTGVRVRLSIQKRPFCVEIDEKIFDKEFYMVRCVLSGFVVLFFSPYTACFIAQVPPSTL